MRLRIGALLLLAVAAVFAAPKATRFEIKTIATGLQGGYQVVMTDMNGDGRLDLLVVASGLPDLLWFENPTWQRHVVATGFKRMINVAALDTDGDRIPELLLAHEFSNEAKKSAGIVSLLEYTGPGKPWRRTDIDQLPTSHRLRVSNGLFLNSPLTADTAEPPDYRGRTPLVYYRPGEWKRRLITDADEGVAHGLYLVDWDGDGKQDILTASFQGIHVLLAQKDGTWTRTRLAGGHPEPWPKSGASDVAAGKLGRKRFLCSIEPWHGNEVVVYTEKGREWVREVIDTTLVDGHTIVTADLDGGGRDVIIAGYRGKGQSVNLYRQQGGKWVKSPLDNGGMGAAACAVGDLNGDDVPDIACIGSATANLKVYWNQRSAN